MRTKMEGGTGEGEGEKRPAKEERNHTVHTCLATTCPFYPPTQSPPPNSSFSQCHHHRNLPGPGSLSPAQQPRDSLGQNVWPLSDTFPIQRPEGGKQRQVSQSSVSWLGGAF